jgi:hypothetical protein
MVREPVIPFISYTRNSTKDLFSERAHFGLYSDLVEMANILTLDSIAQN